MHTALPTTNRADTASHFLTRTSRLGATVPFFEPHDPGCDSYVTNPILQLIQTRAYRSKFGKEAATKPSYGHSSPEEIEEFSEEPEVLRQKVKELASLMRSSSYTGLLA